MNIKMFENKLTNLLSSNNIMRSSSGSHSRNVGKTERWISMAGGAALTYYGFKKKGLTSKLISAAGSSLLARGISGYCPVNNMMGRNSAQEEHQPVESTQEEEQTSSMEPA